MRLMYSLLLVSSVLLAGCAAAPRFAPDSSLTVMSPAPGYFKSYRSDTMNSDAPLTMHITLTVPVRGKEWAPAGTLCVVGAKPSEMGCLRLRVLRDHQRIDAMAVSGVKSTSGDRIFTPFRGQVGKPIAVEMLYDARGYTIKLDGQPFPVAPVDFEITGYAIACSSAQCLFDMT